MKISPNKAPELTKAQAIKVLKEAEALLRKTIKPGDKVKVIFSSSVLKHATNSNAPTLLLYRKP